MADTSTTNSAQRMYGWFQRLIPIGLTVVGLIFAVVGGFLLATQGWERADGTVGQCTVRSVAGAGSGSSRQYTQDCQVSWTAADGVARTGTVTSNQRDALAPGQPIALRVHGDQVREDSPAWVGPAIGGFGLVVAGVGVFLLVRSRRRAAAVA